MSWSLVAVLAINLAVLAASWLLLRGWLERRLSAARQTVELGDEIGRLVAELNQVTDRNVAVVEDRVASLNELLAAADKKIGLLRREIERHEAGSRLYSHLAAPRARAAAAAGDSVLRTAETEQPAPSSAQPVPPPEKSAASKAPPAEEAPLRAGADARTAIRAEIGRLHRTGLPAAAIAARVGAPLGEVELILSLEQRARGT